MMGHITVSGAAFFFMRFHKDLMDAKVNWQSIMGYTLNSYAQMFWLSKAYNQSLDTQQ